MVEQVTFQTLFQFLQTVGILVGVFYYITTIRTNKRNQELQLETRQASLFMQLYDKLTDKEFAKIYTDFVYLQEWDNYNDYIEKYGYRNNLDAWSARIALSNYFEGIGVLIKRELIDPALVDDLMSTGIMGFWEKWGPIVEEYRKDYDNPRMSEYQEYLYNKIRSIVEE